jgi:hypothetical protein
MARQFLRTEAGKLCSFRVNKREAAVLEFAKQVATVVWDFSVDGGAAGTFSFATALPANAVVTDVYSDEQTATTAATLIKLRAGTTDLTADYDFTLSTGTNKQTLASSATAIKPSATVASELNMVITTTAATAGKIRWAVEYYISKS